MDDPQPDGPKPCWQVFSIQLVNKPCDFLIVVQVDHNNRLDRLT